LTESALGAEFCAHAKLGRRKTFAQRERFAAERREDAGFEVLAPKTQAKGRIEPLFRSYVFVKIADRWRAVETTLGVHHLVRFGDAPARCPDAEIADLQGRMDADGFIRLPAKPPKLPRRKIPAGAKIKIAGLRWVERHLCRAVAR
jgi:transcription antitermination factor NusG